MVRLSYTTMAIILTAVAVLFYAAVRLYSARLDAQTNRPQPSCDDPDADLNNNPDDR